MKIQVVRYGSIYMLKVIAGPLAMRVEGEYSSPEEAIRAAQEKCPGCEVEDKTCHEEEERRMIDPYFRDGCPAVSAFNLDYKLMIQGGKTFIISEGKWVLSERLREPITLTEKTPAAAMEAYKDWLGRSECDPPEDPTDE